MTPGPILEAYLLMTTRMVLGLAFGVSAFGKMRNVAQFREAVRRFHMLPTSLVPLATYSFLVAECAVVALLAIGGAMSWSGLVLAGVLLAVFTAAIASAIRRGMRIPCNCFGAALLPLGPLDLVRNILLGLCASGGVWFLSNDRATARLSPSQVLLAALWALSFVMIVLNLTVLLVISRRSAPAKDRVAGG